jgi:uncharacterized phage-like protein YoqJ
MIVAFCGHRPNKIGGYNIPNPTYDKIYQRIIDALRELKATKAISGMALGVDQWAAKACIELDIPFIAAIPFKGQEGVWPLKSKTEYKSILDKACEIVIVSPGGYSPEKMHIRNHWMVDHCDKLIAVWNGTPGGTQECVTYANSINREVFRIDVDE